MANTHPSISKKYFHSFSAELELDPQISSVIFMEIWHNIFEGIYLNEISNIDEVKRQDTKKGLLRKAMDV